MKREIKFRAWEFDNKGGKLVYGYESFIGEALQKGYELMQFTGLHDKNGKEIYEGDIMKDRFGAICQIVYVADFGSYKQLSEIGYSPLNQIGIISDNDTVVGNIYENPELIKPA